MLMIIAASILLAGCPAPKGPKPPPAWTPKERISEEPAPMVASVSTEQVEAKSTAN
jgi:hypothetical protein